jgi:hypothetical protein
MVDMENLIKALERKSGDKVLADLLKQSVDNGRMIRSLKDIEALMRPNDFMKTFNHLFNGAGRNKKK